MSLAGAADLCLEVSDHVRWISSPDGPALLDRRSGKYFALNPVGGLVWAGIERREPARVLVERLAVDLAVPRERIERDVEAFVAQLLGRGLVRARPCPRSAGLDPLPAVPAPVLAAATEPAEAPPGEPGSAATQRMPLSFAWFALAYLALLACDACLKLAGYNRFQRAVSRFPLRPRRGFAPSPRALARVVDRAAAYYFKRAWCLQRSAVTAVLLRLLGWPAQVVIGVRRIPFLAHAWVEVDFAVINDREAVGRFYERIDRW